MLSVETTQQTLEPTVEAIRSQSDEKWTTAQTQERVQHYLHFSNIQLTMFLIKRIMSSHRKFSLSEFASSR